MNLVMQKKRIRSLRAAAALSILVLFACASTGEAQERCPTKKKDTSSSQLIQKLHGGKPAPWGRYPYAVSLRTRQSRQHVCGGTLVAKDLVLTAAHCVHEDNPNAEPLPFLRIGGTDLDDDPDAEEIEACRIFIHSKYTSIGSVVPYDLALIQLKENSSKQPCKLGVATSGEVTTVGWGLNDRGFRDAAARELELSVMGLDQCRTEGGGAFQSLLDSQMCAKSDNGAVCKGDSGGPLLRLGGGCGEDDSLWGVVSGGSPCFDGFGTRMEHDTAGVYTRVSSFADWIDSLPESDFILHKNPACKTPLPQQLQAGVDDGMLDTLDVTVPFLTDAQGCYFVEGVIFAPGIVPLNNGHEDVLDTPGECCDLCKNTPGCRAWGYYRIQEKYSPKGACWLASIVPPPIRCTACTAGLVKPELLNAPEKDCDFILGMDLHGSDLLSVPASKAQDCCKKCREDTRCNSFTHRTDEKMCFLKSGIGQLQICARCQSGIIRDRVQTTDDVEVILRLIPGIDKTFQALKQITVPGPCRLSIGMGVDDSLLKKENVPFVTTPEECCNLCKANTGCRSWTMITVPTALRSQAGQCYMRSDVPDQVVCAACISGVVEGEETDNSSQDCGFLDGLDLEGGDLEQPAQTTSSPKECCDLCGTTPGCKSWTRTRLHGKCYLKYVAAPVVKQCPSCVSGIRLDKVTAEEIASLSPVITKP